MMSNKVLRPRHGAGFTLIEILVALAVLAIAVAAVVAAVSGNINNEAYLRDRTLAHWVGMNKIAELQVSKDWPSVGTQHGESLMATRQWSWQVKVSATEDPDVRRLDVEVFADQDQKQALTNMVAYVGRPSTGEVTATGQTPP